MKTLNTMKMLTLGLLAVMLAGLFVLPATAIAQEGGDVTVDGRGRLYAKGSGEVEISMGGHIRLRVDGDVSIVDNAGDMRGQCSQKQAKTNPKRRTYSGPSDRDCEWGHYKIT